MPTLSRMTARSVVLSVLLGAHPAWATASELIRLTADFDISEPTVRVALTRMVSAGDLVRSEDGYRLSDRLLARQRRQDDAINPAAAQVGRHLDHAGDHQCRHRRPHPRGAANHAAGQAVRRTSRGRVAAARQPRRGADGRGAATGCGYCTPATTTPAELAARLWDLPGWARIGQRLLDEMATATDIPGRFVAAAAMVRHLLTDPVLPDELLPDRLAGRRICGRPTRTSPRNWSRGATMPN